MFGGSVEAFDECRCAVVGVRLKLAYCLIPRDGGPLKTPQRMREKATSKTIHETVLGLFTQCKGELFFAA